MTEKNGFWVGVSVGVLFVFSFANIVLVLFAVPRFEQIFADALPGKPLPSVTEFIITSRFVLLLIALGLPIAGAVLVRLKKPYAFWCINFASVWTVCQIGITILALYMPVAGTLSDGGANA